MPTKKHRPKSYPFCIISIRYIPQPLTNPHGGNPPGFTSLGGGRISVTLCSHVSTGKGSADWFRAASNTAAAKGSELLSKPEWDSGMYPYQRTLMGNPYIRPI